MTIKRFVAIENRLDGLEGQMAELSELTAIAPRMAALESHLDARLKSIEGFVGGYNSIAGIAKKHWRTGLTFGAGIMSAAGIGNPKVTAFITGFFGG